MKRSALAATLCGLAGLVVLVASEANAQLPTPASPPPTTVKPAGYSQYEIETIRDVTAKLGETVDPSPDGKTIERIDVHPLDVLEPRDPAPLFLNTFHSTTKPYVIDREVLQRPGDRYQQTLVDETARNLSGVPQLSLVVVLAVRGTTPDKVRLLVITKDVWSLRLSTDFQADAQPRWQYDPIVTAVGTGVNVPYLAPLTGLRLSGAGLDYLFLQPAETNVFGTQQTVLARYIYYPEAHWFGVGYRVPRLDGRWLTLSADFNVIVNRRSGNLEGHTGAVSISRPLYSTLTEWAWSTGVAWRQEVVRTYVNAKEADFLLKQVDPVTGLPVDTGIPNQYRARRLTESAQLTRSYGWETKNDFSLGAEMNVRAYHTDDLSRVNAAYVREFVDTVLPVSDTRVGPYVQWRGYQTNFVRVLDFETLGLQENYRLGHDLWVRLYPVTTALGSTRSFFGAYAAAQYTVRLGDGLWRAGVESTTEAESERLSDAAVGANMRFVTPRLGFGRFVVDGAFVNRYRNYLNRTTLLGGDTRLRGYPTSFFRGKDVFAANVEFRTRPVEILTMQLGAAVFYDVGDAANGLENMRLHQSVGVGLRTLFPQINKVVFRTDLGFPIGVHPAGVAPVAFFFALEQAFPVNNVGGTVATGGTGSSAIGGALGQ